MSNSGAVFDDFLIAPSGQANASLNGIPFRLNPDQIQLGFNVKTSQINTLGGTVVQLYGVEYSDIVITGSFGKGSYVAQETFLKQIDALARYQAIQPLTEPPRPSVPFTFPLMGQDYTLQVYLKDYSSPLGEAVVYDNTLVNIQWTLTLFVDVEDSKLTTTLADQYLADLAQGLGYQYNQSTNSYVGYSINQYSAVNASDAQAAINNAGGVAAVAENLFGGPTTTTGTITSTGSTGSTILSGNNNQQIAYNYFVSNGFTAIAAAGIVGNLMQESSSNLNATDGQDSSGMPQNGIGFGIAQWTYTSRQAPLVAFAQQAGIAVNTLQLQLAYIVHEMKTSYPAVYTAVNAAHSASDAADIICNQYEIPEASEANLSGRETNAQTIYTKYGGSS